MKHLHAIVAVSAIAATAIFATTTTIVAAPRTETGMSGEVSSAKRYYHRRHYAPGYGYEPRYHRGFNDPSIAPNGRPYRVPEYLRNQCYIDEGYGRFSACPNR
jgi:hypothetical protein